MPTTTITAADLVRRYAADLAYVVKEPPATDLSTLIDHLDTAVPRYDRAGIGGHEDLETAVVHLAAAHRTADDTERSAFLATAGELLEHVRDMTEEYRRMVGGGDED